MADFRTTIMVFALLVPFVAEYFVFVGKYRIGFVADAWRNFRYKIEKKQRWIQNNYDSLSIVNWNIEFNFIAIWILLLKIISEKKSLNRKKSRMKCVFIFCYLSFVAITMIRNVHQICDGNRKFFCCVCTRPKNENSFICLVLFYWMNTIFSVSSSRVLIEHIKKQLHFGY